MNSVRAMAAALLMIFGDVVLAREPVEASLVVPDVRILPGVPFDFWVELHNRSDSVFRISVCAPFQVRLVAGEPLEWTETREEMRPRDQFYWSHGGEAIVGPGETKFLAIPASSSLSGGFFRERFLSAPGRRYAIALPLCQQVVASTGPRAESSRLMTSETELEIVSPAGSDALVWSFMEKASKHRWTPADMAKPQSRAMWESIRRDFPDSNYVPYAVLMTNSYLFNDWADLLALQLRTIRRFPDSPVLEGLHVDAWQTARALRLHGVMLAEGAILRRSKRPTARLLAFGHERR